MRRDELAHLHPLLQERDERLEKRPVQPVLVKLVGRTVRGRDHRDAALEQPLEQAADDHRIGDVGDLHLVEGEKPELTRDLFRHRADGVVGARLAGAVQALLHLLHEGVEMHAPLAADVDGAMEQVHQHRLAAPDPAPEVEAADARLGPKQVPEPAAGGLLERRADAVELGQNRLLRRVGVEPARPDALAIGLGNGHAAEP